MSDTVFIYGLVDPRDKKVRYVGKSKNPYARRDNHLSEARMKNRRGGKRLGWLRELNRVGVRPRVIILETVIGCWEEREKHWIASLPGLFNSHPGGSGGWGHLTREQRVAAGQKGGAAGRGSPRCESFREKCRRRGIAEAEDFVARSHKGRRESEKVAEHCRRIAQEREVRRRKCREKLR